MTGTILSCDWGTSSFRLRLVNAADGTVLATTTQGEGIAAVYNKWQKTGLPDNERSRFYLSVIREHVHTLVKKPAGSIPLIISGMASSSIGITELPYGNIPFPISPENLTVQRFAAGKEFEHDILMVSGLRSDNDVMRGEETILVGCDISAVNNSLYIFPGTHSKHAFVANNVLTELNTYMTGELFELLATKSILSGSVAPAGEGLQEDVFAAAVQEGAEGNVMNIIFHVRTKQLLHKISAASNYDYLSGLLIGAELKAVKDKDADLYLVSGESLLNRYQKALSIVCPGRAVHCADADKALVKAHCALAKHFF